MKSYYREIIDSLKEADRKVIIMRFQLNALFWFLAGWAIGLLCAFLLLILSIGA